MSSKVFLIAGLLADEDHTRMTAALADDRLRPQLVQMTCGTSGSGGAQRVQSFSLRQELGGSLQTGLRVGHNRWDAGGGDGSASLLPDKIVAERKLMTVHTEY